MFKKINNNQLFITSLIISGYFAFLFLNAYVIKLENVIIGVIQELVTIPALLILLFLFFFSIKRSIRDKFSIKEYSFWAFVVLFVTVIVTFGRFYCEMSGF